MDPLLVFPDPPPPELAQSLDLAGLGWKAAANAAVAVTNGIVRLLNKEELEGVIGHELAHVKNRDILIASIAAMVAGAISYLTYMFLFFGDDDSRLGLIGTLATFLLAPSAAGIIQMAISMRM